MAYRVLEVTLHSGRDLKNVNFISRMEVYAVANISGDPLMRQCTPSDPYGGRHPAWNATLRFTVPPTAAAAGGCLHVLLRAERSLGDRDIGEVIIPLAEIFSSSGSDYDVGPRPPQFASYQVRKVNRSEPRGVLYLSYRLGPVIEPQPQQPQATVVAYPVSHFDPPSPPYPYLPPPPEDYLARKPSTAPFPPPAPVEKAVTKPPPTPPSARAYGGHVAALPAPAAAKAGSHVSRPSPEKADWQVGVPARTNRKNLDFEMGTGGGMLASEMVYAGYRAGLVDGGRAMY